MKPNGTFTAIALVVLIIGFGQISVKGESPTTSPKTPAVIVIRHGLDRTNSTTNKDDIAPTWRATCTNWPTYPIFSWSTNVEGRDLQSASIITPNHRLNNSGDQAAVILGNLLTDFLISQNICPVNVVYAVDPRTKNNTPNPFDTAWPFIHNNTKTVKVILHPKAEWATSQQGRSEYFTNTASILDNLGLIENGQLTKVGTNSKLIFATQDDIGKKVDKNQTDNYIINYFTRPANTNGKTIWQSYTEDRDTYVNKLGSDSGSEILIFTKETNGAVSMEVWRFYADRIAKFSPFQKWVGLTTTNANGKYYEHFLPDTEYWSPKTTATPTTH